MMLGRQLQPDDVVQICASVDEQPEPRVFGSVRIRCDECGRDMWRAPGRPLARLSKTGAGVRPAPLVMPTVTAWLCTSCGAAAWERLTGHRPRF